jgi:hypothetical protein
MAGTGSPISFSRLSCSNCQATVRAASCVSCVQSTGLQGSRPDPDLHQGKSVTNLVPSVDGESAAASALPLSPSADMCGLLQSWGSCVIVGKLNATDEELWRSAGAGVPIDRHYSMVGNPFVCAHRELLCRAFDELLGHVLLNDMDFDRVLPLYYRLSDEQQSGAIRAEPATRRLLLEISRKHGVIIHKRYATRCSAEALRSWVAHHALLMLSGQPLRLLCHCAEGACPDWTCHGQSLAGALLWACRRWRTVRALDATSVASVPLCTHTLF